MKIKNYKLFAILALISASICAVLSILRDEQLCLYHYSGYSPKIYFAEMNGFTADEPVLFALAGIVGVIFSIVLVLCKSKKSFLIMSCILIFIIFVLMTMFFSAEFWQIILDSFYYCDNKWLIAWVIGLIGFLLSSLLFFIFDQSD